MPLDEKPKQTRSDAVTNSIKTLKWLTLKKDPTGLGGGGAVDKCGPVQPTGRGGRAPPRAVPTW